MQDLTITMVQTSLFWGDRDKNLDVLSEKVSDEGPSDLVILPEMFNTGFMTEPEEYYETMRGPTLEWMKIMASSNGCVICGSLIVKENENYYNRLIWMRPDGNYDYYDKRHLFRMAGEHRRFAAGTRRLITELKGWKICPQVCYDLRFPVWSRNRYRQGRYEYDLLIYIANWPEVRSTAWKSLLRARAIENLCVVAGVNRVGIDGNDIYHTGDSAVIGPAGDYQFQCTPGVQEVKRIILRHKALEEFRDRFQAGKDWDQFHIK